MKMSLCNDYAQIQDYMVGLVPERPGEMQEMERYAEEHNFPIIGPVAGYYCYQVALMNKARSVFEMGSGYGYSTAWFALAVKETCEKEPGQPGIVHHVVWDADLSRKARAHLKKMGLDSLVEFHVAEANQTLRDRSEQFDLIFCDIDKEAYPDALEVIDKKLRPGGVLIIDNMIWSGQIFDPHDQSAATRGVREFTRRISQNSDWIVSLSPLRDGVIVAIKK
jgi:caffeoyl-CoA O-methyltransferase